MFVFKLTWTNLKSWIDGNCDLICKVIERLRRENFTTIDVSCKPKAWVLLNLHRYTFETALRVFLWYDDHDHIIKVNGEFTNVFFSLIWYLSWLNGLICNNLTWIYQCDSFNTCLCYGGDNPFFICGIFFLNQWMDSLEICMDLSPRQV